MRFAILATRTAFPGLKAIGRIEAERIGTDSRRREATRDVALSKTPPRRLAEVVRAHWTLENQLHWPLDVTFH